MIRPPARVLLGRTLRLRCPACGLSPIFRHGLVRARQCDACEWRYERCQGHWVGGSEVHMIVTFALTFLIGGPVLLLTGLTPAGAVLVVVGHLLFSISFLRHSRAIFLAIDFYIDPQPSPAADDRRGGPRVRKTPDPSDGSPEERLIIAGSSSEF